MLDLVVSGVAAAVLSKNMALLPCQLRTSLFVKVTEAVPVPAYEVKNPLAVWEPESATPATPILLCRDRSAFMLSGRTPAPTRARGPVRRVIRLEAYEVDRGLAADICARSPARAERG